MADRTNAGGVEVRIRHRSALLLLLRKIAIATLAAAPIAAQALGLGQFTLHSGLDEPLNGEIELLSPTTNEIKTLKTTLASREDFEIAGVERGAHLFDIQYTVSQSPNGKYFLKLTTHEPIREPFLHFLIQVQWSGGRLIREYSALLDPPQWVAGQPAEIVTPEMMPETIVSEAPATATAPTAAEAEVPPPVETLPPIGTEPETAQPAAVDAAPAATDTTQVAAAEPPAPAAPAAPETAPAPAPPTETASEPVPPPSPPEAAAVPGEQRPAEPAQMPVEYMPVTEPEVAPAPAHQPEPVAPVAVAGSTDYGPVRLGDTMWQIAAQVNTDKTLSPQQVMIAMLRANPAAFIDNNVNHLKTGKILKVPERDTIAAIPRDQAVREFRAQYDAWQEYKLKLAGSSRALTVADSETPAPKKEAKPGKPAKAEKTAKKPVSTKVEPVDLLKIVRANLDQEIVEDSAKTPGVETKKDAAKEQSKLTERVATLEEAIESKQMQNKEMRDRVGKLQDQVKNTERLIELENKDLAQAQKLAAEKQAAEAAAKAAAEKAAAEKAAADKAMADKAAQEKAAADAAKAAATARTAEAQKPAPAKKPAAIPPPPPPEEGFLDGLLAGVMDNPITLPLLGGVGILLLGMGAFQFYRRRRASREFTESILSGNSLSAEASITDTSGQAAASDTSFLSDFSQGGMGNIHTDEVDPIAEAEVYLAYGRDEQAEEILKDAIVKDPVRQELKGKLLEIYFQRHDVGAFETLAEELYAQLEGKGGKVWDKAEEMGRKLSPANPMFRGGKPAGMAGAAATTMLVGGAAEAAPANTLLETQGFDLATSEMAARPADDGMSLDFDAPAAPPPAEASGLDMTLDFDTGKAEPAAGGFDLDLGLGEAPAEPATNVIDFNLPASGDSGLDFSPSSASAEPAASSGLDFSPGGMADNTLEFEKTETATAEAEPGLPGWDETATKLDLAKAYIDMGDAEGARSILDEVMVEGNDQQKQQARDLASQIAA